MVTWVLLCVYLCPLFFSAVGGLDLEAILETAKRKSEGAEAKQMLVDIVDDGTGDRVQVSLE